jgi:ribonuclease-3
MEFRDMDQTRDENNSPVFTTQVFIEGLEGSKGTGYSKKESQQKAAKDTLQRLRREPQFIDAIFAVKADRTKMEEEPVMVAPDPEKLENPDFIIEHEKADGHTDLVLHPDSSSEASNAKAEQSGTDDDFSLDDITGAPHEKTREEIIAEAEAAAFAEMNA